MVEITGPLLHTRRIEPSIIVDDNMAGYLVGGENRYEC